MASGSIENNKVTVAGFTTSTTDEQIYKVVVSGTSNAELSSGATIESNIAVVKHEKHAEIILLHDGSTCEGYDNAITIQTTNIQDETLVVMSFPSFVSNFTLVDKKICYNLYPNYNGGFTEDEKFVVAGFDIYGNLITSDMEISPGSGYDEDNEKISLHCVSNQSTELSIGASETFFQLMYDFNSAYTVGDSIVICELSGDVVSGEISSRSDYYGIVDVTVRANTSRNAEKIYKVKVCGKTHRGDDVSSNEVIVHHQSVEKNVNFYLDGDDIDYSDTEALFDIIYEVGKINEGTLGIVSCVIDTCGDSVQGSAIRSGRQVRVTVNENNTPCEREIYVTVSAKTTDGQTVTASDMVIQSPGVDLRVYDDNNNPVSSTTSARKSEYYEQTRTIKYTSKNVTNITGTLEQGTGQVVINTSQKTALVKFTNNTTDQEKTFKVKITGTKSNGGTISAYYTFKQTKYGGDEFKLTSGNTSTSGTITYLTTAFNLKVTAPAGYTNFGVSKNESNSQQYKVYQATLGNSNQTLNCAVYQNQSQSNYTYVLQVSATTQNGTTAYTNDFVVTHQCNQGDGYIRFSSPYTATVGSDASSYDSISYTENGLTYVYIESVTASDGAVVNATLNTSTKKVSLTFPAYPSENRTIKVKLGGTDAMGRVHKTGDTGGSNDPEFFVLTQTKAQDANITIKPQGSGSYTNPASMSTGALTFSFDVKYTNIKDEGRVIIYDEDIFQNVTTTSGKFLNANEMLDPVTYEIRFRGKSRSTNDIVDGILYVTQNGADCGEASLVISSNSTLLQNGIYVVGPDATSVPIYIDEDSFVDYDTLVVVINGEERPDLGISFVSLSEAGGGDKPVLTGAVNGTTVTIPAGNFSDRYTPKIVTIQKEDATHLIEDTYVYEVEIDPYTVEQMTEVWLVGQTYCGDDVESNHIKFLQQGTPSEED